MAMVTYRFGVRVRLTVRANFYVHFADGIFDIPIFGGWRWVQIIPGKKIQSLPVSVISLGQLNTDF